MKLKTLSVLGLAALLGGSAVQHFRNPTFYYQVVPHSLCTDLDGSLGVMSRKGWIVSSAVAEALAAAGLLIPATRKASATATAVMFTAFTAGHLSALKHAWGPTGTVAQKRAHTVRLPLQAPLIAWAWSARKA